MARGKNPSNQAAKAQREMRILRALELRAMEFKQQQIADELGVSQSTVCKYLDEAEALLRERGIESAAQWRLLELEKLAHRERSALRVLHDIQPAFASSGKIVVDVVPGKNEGDPPTIKKLNDYQTVLQAIGKLNDISARRAKLLGLDAPAKIETTTHEGAPEFDWSKLSEDERKVLRAILEKTQTEETHGETERPD